MHYQFWFGSDSKWYLLANEKLLCYESYDDLVKVINKE